MEPPGLGGLPCLASIPSQASHSPSGLILVKAGEGLQSVVVGGPPPTLHSSGFHYVWQESPALCAGRAPGLITPGGGGGVKLLSGSVQLHP